MVYPCRWGPVYGEEEDLRRAIEMSLADQQEGEADSGGVWKWSHVQCSLLSVRTLPYISPAVHATSTDDSPMMDISGPQFLDSNRLAVTPPPSPHLPHFPLNLPPELRHLLESSQRPGAHVWPQINWFIDLTKSPRVYLWVWSQVVKMTMKWKCLAYIIKITIWQELWG